MSTEKAVAPQSSWKTSITNVKPNQLRLKGYRIDDLIGRISYGEAVYLALKGELPTKNVAQMIDCILVSSIDHGATPPSTLAARTIASTGAGLSSCLAGGILAISKFHGGAIEGCMEKLYAAAQAMEKSGDSPSAAAYKLLEEMVSQREKMPGYGHRFHTDDPRTKKLLQYAEELGIASKYVELAKAIGEELERVMGKQLPLNVDGAIATILCELEFPPHLGNVFFIISRIAGLAAHVSEEWKDMRTMRKIDPVNHEYAGPADRDLP